MCVCVHVTSVILPFLQPDEHIPRRQNLNVSPMDIIYRNRPLVILLTSQPHIPFLFKQAAIANSNIADFALFNTSSHVYDPDQEEGGYLTQHVEVTVNSELLVVMRDSDQIMVAPVDEVMHQVVHVL